MTDEKKSDINLNDSKVYQWLYKNWCWIRIVICIIALGILVWYALMLRTAQIDPCGFCERQWHMTCTDMNLYDAFKGAP
jgi:hypothetical protein